MQMQIQIFVVAQEGRKCIVLLFDRKNTNTNANANKNANTNAIHLSETMPSFRKCILSLHHQTNSFCTDNLLSNTNTNTNANTNTNINTNTDHGWLALKRDCLRVTLVQTNIILNTNTNTNEYKQT